jgi:hypothetical protein
MLRTAVPEAAVDEDGHALGWEHDIGATPKSSDGLPMNAKAQPFTVQSGTDCAFRSRVTRAVSLHHRARCIRGRARRRLHARNLSHALFSNEGSATDNTPHATQHRSLRAFLIPGSINREADDAERTSTCDGPR